MIYHSNNLKNGKKNNNKKENINYYIIFKKNGQQSKFIQMVLKHGFQPLIYI